MAHRLTLDALPIETDTVLFDLTRLIRSIERPVATGIDRIDLAIGQDLSARFGARCRFVHQMRGAAFVSDALGREILSFLDASWHGGPPVPRPKRLLARLLAARVGAALFPAAPDPAETTYVVASHSGLFRRAGLIDRIDPAGEMARLVYLHDLIPLEYPDLQTPKSVATFRDWLSEAAHGPVRFAVNSRDTATRLVNYGAAQGWTIAEPVVRVPRLALGSGQTPPPRAALQSVYARGRPVFLALGTIEPRKNHGLLLDIWKGLAQGDSDPPILLISGRRGWMNQDVFETLDWDETLDGHVLECSDLSDDEVAFALAHSAALLFPSFAEGLGLPVMEAAAYALPVIAANLPVLHEIAADGTLFLPPEDHDAWRRAILTLSKARGG